VFLAGATGAIGKRLVLLLVRAGHSVTGTTRHRDKAESMRAAGAILAVLDALNPREVLEAVQRVEPDVIIHQLTALPARFNPRRFAHAFAATNRLRSEATDHLLAAARAVGCRRVIAQSYAGWYARTGAWVKTEEDPLMSSPEPAVRQSLRAILHVESAVLQDRTIEGCVLRYGAFYGPGTALERGGSLLEDIRQRRMPIVGTGTGHWSFNH
jgi:2-alkyl-3-oxoalkanoate reductase